MSSLPSHALVSYRADVGCRRIAPLDVAGAASTGLFNINSLEWDQQVSSHMPEPPVSSCVNAWPSLQVTSLVMGGGGVDRVRQLLGTVELDGGAIVGPVAGYLIQHFGFSPDCSVVPFTIDTAASALAYPFKFSTRTQSTPSGVVCLSVDDRDTVVVPAARFVPAVDWAVSPHPATNLTKSPAPARYIVTIE